MGQSPARPDMAAIEAVRDVHARRRGRPWRELGRLRQSAPPGGGKPRHVLQAADFVALHLVRRAGRDHAGDVPRPRARRPLPGADRQRRERPAHPRGAHAAPRGCVVGDRPRRRQPVRDHPRRRVDRRADGAVASRQPAGARRAGARRGPVLGARASRGRRGRGVGDPRRAPGHRARRARHERPRSRHRSHAGAGGERRACRFSPSTCRAR